MISIMHSLGSCCLLAFCVLLPAPALGFCENAAHCCPLDANQNATDTPGCALLTHKVKRGSRTEQPQAAIVSASYGRRAAASVLPQCPEGLRCVMYTDSPVAENSGWWVSTEPYHANSEKLAPRLNSGGRHSWNKIWDEEVSHVMAAKFYKMNMFLLPELAGINVIMWHDADWGRDTWFHAKVSLPDRMNELLRGFPMVVEKHAWRNTVSAEMMPAAKRAYSGTHYGYAGDEIYEAYHHQMRLGFKDDALYNGARFLIDSNWPGVRSAFLGWWHEVQNFTFRDQISFPFIVQRFKLPIRVLEKWQIHEMILGEMAIP